MDIAQCTLDGIKYDIASFSNLDPGSLNKKRSTLICTECKGKGFFRRKSSDGKPACFGAYHEENCKYKSKESAPRYDPSTVEEVNSIITNSDTIDINFTTYTVSQLNAINNRKPSSHTSSSFTKTKQHTRQPVQYKNVSKGLRSLLRMLMQSDSFKNSDIKIDTGYKHPYKAKNLFVNFNDITKDHLELWRGYWGIISHSDPAINWMNTANAHDVSIPISEHQDYIKEVFNISSDDDLVGAAILVFGKLYTSKSNDNKKWYIKVNTNRPDHIFIKLTN